MDSSIRGVRPRGLIEAKSRRQPPRARWASAGYAPAASLKQRHQLRPVSLPLQASAGYAPAASLKRGDARENPQDPDRASAGYAPAASLKLDRQPPRGIDARWASAGYAPAASLKRVHGPVLAARCPRGRCIRGVRPRGLIEAVWPVVQVNLNKGASAGYAPAASLKQRHVLVLGRGRGRRIRGVRPRGLIEARAGWTGLLRAPRASAGYAPAASLKRGRRPRRGPDARGHPRGTPPRPH